MSDSIEGRFADALPPRVSLHEQPSKPEGSSGAYRRLFANKNFRRMWYGQFVSGIGDWLVIGFLIPLVTTMSGGSSFAVAGILVAKIIPALVFSSFIGVGVDRFDRRKVMIWTELAATAISLTLVFASNVWQVYFAVLALETTSLCFWPARNSLIPYLVDKDDVTAANGLAYTTGQASMIIGLTAAAGILGVYETVVRWVLHNSPPTINALVGPLAPALLGARAGVILDSFTFLFSAIMIISMVVTAQPPRKKEPLSWSLIGKDVFDSLKFLGSQRELRSLIITIGLAILGGATIIPVGANYVTQNLSGALPFASRFEQLRQLTATPTTFMLVFMAFGMVFGALTIPRFEHRIRLQWLFGGSVMAFGLALLGFASVTTYGVAGLFAMAAGACVATLSVAGNGYVVRTTSDELRGRVFTALESVQRLSLLLSMIVMAPIADLIGKYVYDFAVKHQLTTQTVYWTGSRITLQLSSLIVMGAAVYAFRALRWSPTVAAPLAPAADATRPAEEPADA
ncbi:MAG: MFS transporter [Coriobacteriia bacterium]|nr:MFS transporter [Coriobacteriia bacterium]